jgi:hypothetical protein
MRNEFLEFFESKGVNNIKNLTAFVHNNLREPAIFFDLTEADRTEMEQKWMQPWLFSKIENS